MKLTHMVFQQLLEHVIAQIAEADSQATDQAHKLGLVSKGWGRWANPETGEIVAKTVQGNLVKIDPKKGSHELASDEEDAYVQRYHAGWGGSPKPIDQRFAANDPDLRHNIAMQKTKEAGASSAPGKFTTGTRDMHISSANGDSDIRKRAHDRANGPLPKGAIEQDKDVAQANLQKARGDDVYYANLKHKHNDPHQRPKYDPALTHGEVPLSGPLPDKPGVSKKDMLAARKFDRKNIAKKAAPVSSRAPKGEDAFDPAEKKMFTAMAEKHGADKVGRALVKVSQDSSAPEPLRNLATRYLDTLRQHNRYSGEDFEYSTRNNDAIYRDAGKMLSTSDTKGTEQEDQEKEWRMYGREA